METIEDCPACQGTGIIIQIEDDSYIQFGCRDCVGTGWISIPLTPEEQRTRKIKRIARGVFVILLTAVPTLIFVLMAL